MSTTEDGYITPPEENLAPLPTTYEGFLAEYNPGLRQPVHELFSYKKRVTRQKLLSFAYDSHGIGRSSHQTILLLLGETGVGKSATVNHLFGREVAKTSSDRSETRDMTEYLLSADDHSSCTKDLSLAILDTPGLNDTEGFLQDACNMACIKNAMLGYGPLLPITGNSILKPNVILIFLKANDTRYEGNHSNFSQSLLAVKELDIVDTKRNNVIVVLTHAMSIGNPKENPSLWTDALQTKIIKIKQVVMRVLYIYPEVVYVENHYQDIIQNDMKAGYNLPKMGDWTVLPDNTLQILNLYKSIATMLQANGDNLALHTMNKLFTNASEERSVREVTKRELFKALDATGLKPKDLGEMEQRMLEVVKLGHGLEEGPDEVESEVTRDIKSWITQNLSEPDQKREASNLCLILSTQLDISKSSQLLGHSLGTLQQNMPKPENLTSLHIRMLKDIFGVQEKKRLSPAVSYIGKGYDILKDALKDMVIFDFTDDDLCSSQYGIQIPKQTTFHEARTTKSYMNVHSTKEEYIESRLTDLSIPINLTNSFQVFQLNAKAGFTLLSKSKLSSKERQYSFLYEKRLYEIKLKDLADESLKLSQSFERALAAIPNTYDESNRRILDDMRDFFDTWGHYVVIKAFAGGSVEVQVLATAKDNVEEKQCITHAQMITGGMFNKWFDGTVDLSLDLSSSQVVEICTAKSSLTWNGGNQDLHVPMMDKLPQVLQQWEQSVSSNPTFLVHNMGMVPIYELVKETDKKNALKDAFRDIFKEKPDMWARLGEGLRKVGRVGLAAHEALFPRTRMEAIEDFEPIERSECIIS